MIENDAQIDLTTDALLVSDEFVDGFFGVLWTAFQQPLIICSPAHYFQRKTGA